ncbi:MAG: helix-turn-helix transcriptional regulator [Candidatus Margulisbacteria bacterium]|jgi:transcriptional regulator with XRE-family HTH domain|nr:helix-turn-helix transcriptional regulator [Candidatus Margulisiibacteriota bacterium]
MEKTITDADLKALIGRKLQQLRKKSQKTIEETADFLDLDYAQYHRILKGLRLPHLVTLIKINQAYGLDMNWWFKELAKIPAPSAAKISRNTTDHELLNRFHNLDAHTQEFLLQMLRSKKGNFLFMFS